MLQKIQAELLKYDIDALLITSPANRRYAVDFPSSDGWVLVTQDVGYCFVDFRYITAAQEQVKGYNVMMVSGTTVYEEISRVLTEQNVQALGFEQNVMSVAAKERYAERLRVSMRASGELLTNLRAVKDPIEVNRITAAQRLCEQVFTDIIPLIRPGMTERRLAAEIVYRILSLGAERIAFDPIVVSGPNSALPHGVPGERFFVPGDAITMDFGCVLDGYCSDMTRTVVLGKASAEQKKVYQVVLDAQTAGIAAAKAGVTGKAVDGAARAVIQNAGYGEYFGHGFGHGVGIEVHEEPGVHIRNEKPLPVGAVVSAEPGIYLPGHFGVRIEDTLYLTADGNENITRAPKGLMEL